MDYIILASHGGSAKGMLDTLAMLVGDTGDRVRALSLDVGEDAQELFYETIEEIKEHPSNSYIILTDVFGGSVNNAILEHLELENLYVISGMNLGLLLELYLAGEGLDEEVIERCIKDSTKNIKLFHLCSADIEAEDF